MKRLLTLLTLVLCSCAETFVGEEVARPNDENLPNLTATFADEEATRTYIEEGKYLRWNEDDRLTIFFGNTLNRQYRFNGKTGDNSGTFSLVPDGMLGTGNAFDRIYALYPYNADVRITDEGVISLVLPAVQNYAENSFGRGANTMLAVTENVEDTFLSFKNTCGYLKLKLYNAEGASIKSIDVKGNSGEKLAGAATATIAFGEAPVLAMADDATTSVTLDCGEGVALGTTAETATEFWFVLPATTFAEGLTITATDTEGKVFKKSTTKEVVIERNAIQPMAALVAECTPPGPADNEIWYTNGSTTEATTPYKTDVFGTNIASNTYDAEKECWVIRFDSDVTTIGNYAFRGCTNLTSVTIPDSTTTIGNYAFYQCSSLTSVNIGDSVTSIGYYAFQYCSSLKEFTGKFATEDGRSLIIDNTIIAYANASGTTYTIPDSVTTIGDSAFQYCRSLTSVTIPDSVTEISRQAFDNCSSITSITIPNSVTKIGEMAFANCNSLTSVTIGNGVTEIGNRAFVSCYNLQEFRGNSASEDGRCIIIDGVLNSFAKASLTEYTIPDSVTSIGSSAFYYCSSLTSVTIPDSVTEIGNSAFCGCSSLTSITIPDSVTKIGSTAFSGCSSIISITIPNSVTEIGSYAFEDCTGELFVNCNISESAIRNSSFSSVTIGDGVTTIGDYAFYYCSSLTSVTIPDSVTNIGFYAFFNCSNLSYVYCKRFTPPITTMTTSGFWDAFDNTNYYLKIYVPSFSSKSLYKDTAGWSKYKDKFVEYIFEQDIDSEMPLKPTEHEIWYTTSFHNYEPYQNSLNPFNVDIISLTYNTNSKYWIIKLDNKVTKINDSAFEATGRWMTGIFLPDSITEIGKCAFNNCFELSNINLPSNIISIGKWAFHYCTSLTSLTIPESIETIESYAFAYCSSLTSVYCKATTPPNGGESMFDSNASDRKIYVPMESVEAYKSASYWKNYASDIVGYDF